MIDLPFASTTPVHVNAVGLKARDGEALATFYRDIVGLAELAREEDRVMLGIGGRRLLTIEHDPAAQPDDPTAAGLFHTAFLLPDRADLARWLRRAMEKNIALDGASDHLVSEAIYLSDPEGNGIEIYADRPKTQWARRDGQLAMDTLPLDFSNLLAAEGADGGSWQGVPESTVIGHVHLRVGDPKAAEEWWREKLGLETMVRYGTQAVFLASGGYHHHIGANNWRSAGAGPREGGRTGLSWVEMTAPALKATELRDPWGTVVRVVPGAN